MPRESSWGGSVASLAPHSLLSPRTACGLRTPRGTWLGLSHIPLQLQPTLSEFLCLMQVGETTQVSKGRAPWGTELLGRRQALPLSARVTCRPSWAVEEQLRCLLWAQQGRGRRAGACLVLHGSCCEWLCYLALSLEGE